MNKIISLYVIVLLASLLWGGEYLMRDYWEPDEGRYALVTREMLNSGDWLVMHRQGEHYSHKPPLFFWIAGVASRIGNEGAITRLAIRVPSFLGAIMALWAASRIASMWFSRQAGWLTVFILSSSYLFWSKGGFGQTDMLLCGLQMMSLYCLYSASDNNSRIRIITAYLFMGLAVLAKGPVGFLVPWGIYACSSFFNPGSRFLPRVHYILGPIISLSIPALWLGAAWLRGAPDEYLGELLFLQNIGRVSGGFGGHQQPFYYFLKYLPVDFLPWTLLIPLSAAAHFRERASNKAAMRLAVWAAFVVLLFSLSSSKRNLYILMVYPAAAMFVAAGVDHWGRVSERLIRNSVFALLAILVVMMIALVALPFYPESPVGVLMIIPPLLTLAIGGWLTVNSAKEKYLSRKWLITFAITIMITFSSVGALIYPRFNELKTPEEIVDKAHSLLGPSDRILMYRQHGEMISLYADRMGYMAFTDENLVRFLQEAHQTNHFIVAFEKDWPDLIRFVGPDYETGKFSVGNKELVWIALKSSE